jgi:precorrin-6A/cobalt-precorrin-6A reductase
LILGGTTEASALARAVSEAGIKAVFSYAGRVAQVAEQPVPVRVGGFGGTSGLITYLRESAISHVVDATHPFAAGMSQNAVVACEELDIPLIALTRAPWQASDGDTWHHVNDIEAAVDALDGPSQRVFLAIGRQTLAAFTRQPQHHYLLRFVDAPEAPPPLPRHTVVVARGPFSETGDRSLLEAEGITTVVSKNAGGDAASAKLFAARALGLPVIMIDRPALPSRRQTHSVDEVLRWVHDGTERGV